MISTLILLAVMFAFAATGHAAAQPRRQTPKGPPKFYTATLPIEQMKNKQAVVETSAGAIVIDLLPEAAPDHVGYVMKLAAEGAFDGTTFHRVLRHGLIQGGDPITRDPAKREPVWHRRPRHAQVPRERPEAHARHGVSRAASRATRFGRHRSSSSASATSPHSTASSPCSAASSRASTWRRRSRRRRGRRQPCHGSDRDPVDDDPGHAAARADAVRSRDAGRARALEGRARHDDGAGVDRVLPDRAPGHVRNFLRLAEARCLRRHVVPPRRPRLRSADGLR